MFRRYGFNIVPKYSSMPADLTAPNGMNFTKSVGNPNSRLEKVRKYLSDNGPRTKREILLDVFGKVVESSVERNLPWQERIGNGKVSYGWGAYLFGYGVRHGFFTKRRMGRTVLWSVK